MHRFRNNEVFLQTGNDGTLKFLSRGRCVQCVLNIVRCGKGVPNFRIRFWNYYYIYISYCFRDDEALSNNVGLLLCIPMYIS